MERIRLVLALALVPAWFSASSAEIRVGPPADPAADATSVIAEAVERAIATGASRLTLSPGTYRIRPPNARERFVWVSSHDAGLRRTAFPLWGARNLEIDGGGAQLIVDGYAFIPFMLYDAENITVRHLSIDWEHGLFAQATITAVNAADDSVEAEFLPECNARIVDGMLVHGAADPHQRAAALWQFRPDDGWQQNLQWTHWIDPTTRLPLPAEQQLPLHAFRPWNVRLQRPAEVEQIGPNRFRVRHGFTPLPRAGTAFAAKGMLMPNRTSPAIHIARSHGVTIEDVVVHHAGGMGMIAESSSDVTLRRYQVRLPPNSPRLVTTTADGSHFTQCGGKILIEDCYYEHMLDDALNVHGQYAVVENAAENSSLAIRLMHFQQLGLDFVRPGERVRLCRQETLLPYAELTVRGVRQINESHVLLTFVEPLPTLQPASIIENANRQPELVFRRNTVRNSRGRGILATTAGRVLIEENTFEGSCGGGMGVTLLFEGDANSWYESSAVQDVTIRRNTFVPMNPRRAVIYISPKQGNASAGQPPYHRNIRIEENVFRTTGPAILFANRAGKLDFIGNKIEQRASGPGSNRAAGPSFVLRSCEGVTVARNLIELSSPAVIEQVTPIDRLVVKDNTGLATP